MLGPSGNQSLSTGEMSGSWIFVQERLTMSRKVGENPGGTKSRVLRKFAKLWSQQRHGMSRSYSIPLKQLMVLVRKESPCVKFVGETGLQFPTASALVGTDPTKVISHLIL